MSTQINNVVIGPTQVGTEFEPPEPFRGRLGEALAQARLITEEELESAISGNTRGLRLGELLLDLGLLSEDQLVPFMAKQLGVPAVRLRDGLVDPLVVRTLDRKQAERLHALVLFSVRGELTVAMEDPLDIQRIDELESLTQQKVRPVFAFRSSIARMIDRGYRDDFEVDAVTADLDENAVELTADVGEMDLASVETLVDGSPIVNLVNYIILKSIENLASDIHIEPGRKQSTVRFRVDGQLQEMLRPRIDVHPAMVSRIKVMAKMDIAEHNIPQDGRCQVVVSGAEIDLRVSTLPTVLGEKIVIRILDKGRLTFDLARLGLKAADLDRVCRLLKCPYGLILVTGPTGSGKTTTLYSALELIKSVHTNIITVEDPVEYQIELINQVQVEKSRGLSFASVLRSILRQDPDVIMVGEIRDAETAEVAVQAALTGHLVISTLHTNDSASAVTRLFDMDVEPFKLAAALQGVVAQRLLRKVCNDCRTAYFPSQELLQALNYEGDSARRFVKGEGCRKCFDTGLKGRTGIYEVLVVSPELRRMIGQQKPIEDLRGQFVKDGGTTLLSSGLVLAEKEITSLDEVARVAFSE